MAKRIHKLGDKRIRELIGEGQPTAVADGDGLTLTISAAGTASWVLRYRHGGRPRELTLGRYPDLTLRAARARARTERAAIQGGVDVARERQRQKVEAAAATTFRGLASDYMVKVFPRLAANTIKQRRQHIEGVICPRIGSIAVRDVTAADVVSLIQYVGRVKSGNVAELVLTAVSEIFKHGIRIRTIDTNPCTGMSVAAICGPIKPRRQRLQLSEDELRALLPALPSVGTENALATKILLLTCTRIGELARAEWSHIDFDRAEWWVPEANSKTGASFTIPLSEPALACFRALQPLACGSRFVLPARQARRRQRHDGADMPFEHRALNAALHRVCDTLGDKVRRFTPHDLRSTARSHLGRLGVNVVVAERCLNHKLGGLLGVYDRHDYLTERREALDKWAAFVVACEVPGPVSKPAHQRP